MEITYRPETEALREEIRAFCRDRVPEEFKRAVRHEGEITGEDSRRWVRLLHRQGGWSAPGWSRERGGPGWTYEQQYVFERELALNGAPRVPLFGAGMIGPAIIEFGSRRQQEKFLPAILEGDILWCQGYSEPNAGSDLASLQARAVRDGDHYVINGTKMWTSDGHWADWMFGLFRDPKLSKDNSISCASCHDLASGGDDGRRVSIGVEGRPGVINAPTVFNAGFNFKQFWDGRAATLEDQVDGPVQSVIEMGSLWPDVIVKLFQDQSYPRLFKNLYPDGITRKNVKDAIAEFVRSLVAPNSRFDRWLNGDATALNEQEKRGYDLFKHYGCVSCHQGVNVGGNMFQVFGVLNEYFKKRGNITDADLGRFNVTGNIQDKHAFKVPSLRMAAHTAPYLHDGSAETLRDAVDVMFEFQLGREAPDEDKEAIVAFIRTLAGEPGELPP